MHNYADCEGEIEMKMWKSRGLLEDSVQADTSTNMNMQQHFKCCGKVLYQF